MHTITPNNSYPHIIASLSIIFLILTLILRKTEGRFIIEWTFLSLNSVQITIPVLLDPIGTIFIATVTFISFNVLTFSKTYIKEEPNLTRFTHLLSLFIISILLLIMSPNIISIILGWDGLGFTRFLLVIYYQNASSLKRGMITALTNRIGDAFLLVAIGLIISQGHWNIINIWRNTLNFSTLTATLITLAAITKRAQLPFHAWLPEAIAAPTPVSALVHSSTLVTAGVFILIRLYPFLSETKIFNSLLLASGLVTTFIGAYWSAAFLDQKKAVALSTISQLGLIIVSLGLNIVTFCFIHLLTHAIFKATIFIGVGIHIIITHHRQIKENLRIHTYMPVVRAATGLSLISINAFFFLAGYYSKELILETSIYQPHIWLLWWVLGAATIFTIIYRVPLWRVNVLSPITQKQYPYIILPKTKTTWYINSNNRTLNAPIFLISLGTIIIGRTAYWLFLSPSEIPIFPYYWKKWYYYKHLYPILWTLIGVIVAVRACRLTTKYTNPESALTEALKISMWKRKEIFKRYNINTSAFDKLPFPIKIFAGITIFIKLKAVKKLEKYVKRSDDGTWESTKLYRHNRKSFWGTNKERLRREASKLWHTSTISYDVAKPVLNISLSTLKVLDQGLTILITAEGISTLFPNLSKTILANQSNHSTKVLLLFVILIFIFLPLII